MALKTFTLPPDTRAVGQGNPPADMNAVTDGLLASGAGMNVLNGSFAGGADATGVSDSTAAFQAAGTAAVAAGSGLIVVPAGSYVVQGLGVSVNGPAIKWKGAGANCTFINYYGTGDCFRMTDTGSYTDQGSREGGFEGLTVDGANATGTATSYTCTNASPAVYTATGSSLAAGQPVVLQGGSPATGFANMTTYYVAASPAPTTNTFSLALAPGGTAINSSSTGNGTVYTQACGIHAGDIANLSFDVFVRNFNANSASIGVHLDNSIHWTERSHGLIRSTNNYHGVVFDVSGAVTSQASFGRTDLTCEITQGGSANYNGVVLANGAQLYNGRLLIRGNWQGQSGALTANPYSTGNSPAVLTLAGTVPAGHPGAGSGSNMLTTRLDCQVECSSAAHTPQTIVLDSGSNFIRGCTGILDFGSINGGNFTASNNTQPTSGAFWYLGSINGDSHLAPSNTSALGSNGPPFVVSSSLLFAQGATDGTGGLYTYSGDFFDLGTLSASLTVKFFAGASFTQTPGSPQRIRVRAKQAASGGPYTLTWPSSGSPSVTTPNVVWADGVTPVMSAGASAVDYYMFESIDGATWFGYAVQASPQLPGSTLPATTTYLANAAAQAIPAGATLLRVVVVGGGGGGGGSAGSSPTQIGAAGGGGGAGQYVEQFVSVSSANTFAVTVGATANGGIAGTINQGAPGGDGTAGNDSIFNYHSSAVVVTAKGGGQGKGGATGTSTGGNGGAYARSGFTTASATPASGQGGPGGGSNANGTYGGRGYGFGGDAGGGGGGANAGTANGTGGAAGGAAGTAGGNGGAGGGGGTQTGGDAAANSGAGGGGGGGTETVASTGAAGVRGGNGGSGYVIVQVIG